MNITVRGKAKHVKKKEILSALNFYAEHLLSDKLNDKIDLTLDITKDIPIDTDAYCEWIDTNRLPRVFEFTIRSTLKMPDFLQVLAHEMVHLKQHAKGELFDYARSRMTRYNGKVYDSRSIDYWDLPWEIEAYGRERGLYIRYISHKNDK